MIRMIGMYTRVIDIPSGPASGVAETLMVFTQSHGVK